MSLHAEIWRIIAELHVIAHFFLCNVSIETHSVSDISVRLDNVATIHFDVPDECPRIM